MKKAPIILVAIALSVAPFAAHAATLAVLGDFSRMYFEGCTVPPGDIDYCTLDEREVQLSAPALVSQISGNFTTDGASPGIPFRAYIFDYTGGVLGSLLATSNNTVDLGAASGVAVWNFANQSIGSDIWLNISPTENVPTGLTPTLVAPIISGSYVGAPAPVSGNAVTIPTSTVSAMLADVSAQVSDHGLLALFLTLIGIPIAFYFLKKVRDIYPVGM